jgi:NAD(P)-dependent dehydrogenase (short-subunit alcohol dehydrogenase family)
MNLQGKTCLITGGTKGIGAAVALAFAGRGANLCLNARNRDAEADSLVQYLTGRGARSMLFSGDISVPSAAAEFVRASAREIGVPDVLIHCAGSAAPGDLLSIPQDVWYSAFDLHIHSVFHLCREAVPLMRSKPEGAIVLVSSAAGLRGCMNSVAYSTVKGALPQLARSLARELADDNIRVNCVAPGVIRTRFQDYLTAQQVSNNLEHRIPLHREGRPEDVAELVTTLVTNDYLTGETVTIDGGLTMRIA